MTHRGVICAALFLLTSTGASALAQEGGRIVVPSQKPFSVTGFQPQAGPVGTAVTITGSGFFPGTKVFFGGTPIRPNFIAESQIQFNVPARFRDGTITIRQPAAGEVVVGTFAVAVNPVIASFAPTSGPPGTRVEIIGSGFLPQDQVLFNGRVLPYTEITPNRIVVTIPRGSRSGPFTVTAPGGAQAMSPAQFMVGMPAPTVQGFAPNAGPPGTAVRITGFDFGPVDTVLYGGFPMQITGRTDRTFDVVVPPRARQAQPFVIRGPGHPDVMTAPFNLLMNPVIASFAPTSGAPGTRVEIFGSAFRPGDQVVMAGRPLQILGLEDGRIIVAISPDAQDDVFTLMRGGQPVASSRDMFNVIAMPIIQGFAPTGGPPGTEVAIEAHRVGRGPDLRVFYGRFPVPIISHERGRIVVQVPREARTSEPFIIQARGGEARSAQAFMLLMPVMVEGIEPPSGMPGTRIRIRGQFEGGPPIRFFLSGMELPIVKRERGFIIAEIPNGAPSGVIEIEIGGRREPTRFRFDVVMPRPARIVEIRPTIGSAGTQVIIFGENLPPNPAVTWGRVPVQVVSTAPDQISVVIPPNAPPGSEPFIVSDAFGHSVVTPLRFQVVPPGRGY